MNKKCCLVWSNTKVNPEECLEGFKEHLKEGGFEYNPETDQKDLEQFAATVNEEYLAYIRGCVDITLSSSIIAIIDDYSGDGSLRTIDIKTVPDNNIQNCFSVCNYDSATFFVDEYQDFRATLYNNETGHFCYCLFRMVKSDVDEGYIQGIKNLPNKYIHDYLSGNSVSVVIKGYIDKISVPIGTEILTELALLSECKNEKIDVKEELKVEMAEKLKSILYLLLDKHSFPCISLHEVKKMAYALLDHNLIVEINGRLCPPKNVTVDDILDVIYPIMKDNNSCVPLFRAMAVAKDLLALTAFQEKRHLTDCFEKLLTMAYENNDSELEALAHEIRSSVCVILEEKL